MRKTSLLVAGVAILVAVTLTVHRSRVGKAAPKNVAATETAARPVAPNFTLKDLQDHDVRLDQFKGKVVLVNFWATWCAPCQVEMPWMMEFQQKYGEKGFTVLGVAMDDEGKKAVEPFIRDQRFEVNGQKIAVNYPILIGNDDVAEKFAGLFGLPTSVLVSRDGKKVKTFIGLVDHDKLVEEIEKQL